MNITIRSYRKSDLLFLKEMLYEAVYWRRNPGIPSFEESLSMPDLQKDVDGMGNREGDIAVVAFLDNQTPAGAAWFRYYTEENHIRGYISNDIPVIVIAVKEQYRKQGIGGLLMDRLIDYAGEKSIDQISLCVAKDNHAIKLYRDKGFKEHTDLQHSFNMVRDIKK